MKLELSPMTPGQSRAAALLILLLALAALTAVVAGPAYWLHQHYDRAIESRLDRLTREYRVISTAPELQRQLREIAALDPGRYYLRNANPVLAAAEIQEVAKRQIEANACKLLSIGILPTKDEDNITRVGINVQLTCDLPSLEKILYGLETATPYLFIDNLNLRANTLPIPQGAQQPAQLPPLQVQFDLFGYVLRRPA